MTINDLYNSFLALIQNQDLILRTALGALLLLYLLFAFVLARQISLLTGLINQVTFTPVFIFIAYGVAVATLLLLLAAIFV